MTLIRSGFVVPLYMRWPKSTYDDDDGDFTGSATAINGESDARDIHLGGGEEICAAKITQRNLVQKRQQPAGGGAEESAHNNDNPPTSTLSSPPKSLLLLTIECENLLASDNDVVDEATATTKQHDDVSANLYLYKRGNLKQQLVRHLVDIDGLKLGEKLNRSLVLVDLVEDQNLLKQLALRDFQRDHVIVMSLNHGGGSSNNSNYNSTSSFLANLTIGFTNEPDQEAFFGREDERRKLPIDRFPRTSDYGK